MLPCVQPPACTGAGPSVTDAVEVAMLHTGAVLLATVLVLPGLRLCLASGSSATPASVSSSLDDKFVAAGAPRRSGCGRETYVPGQTVTETMEDQGLTRSFNLLLPVDYDFDARTPLVVYFHGWGGSGNLNWISECQFLCLGFGCKSSKGCGREAAERRSSVG